LAGKKLRRLGDQGVRTFALFKGGSTGLKVKRDGDRFVVSYSHDGKELTAAKEFAAALPKKLQAGVVAVNTSAEPLTAEFAELRITTGRAPAKPVPALEPKQEPKKLPPFTAIVVGSGAGQVVIRQTGKHEVTTHDPVRGRIRVDNGTLFLEAAAAGNNGARFDVQVKDLARLHIERQRRAITCPAEGCWLNRRSGPTGNSLFW